MKKIIYYESFNEDVVKSKNQDYKLKNNYKWIHTNIFYKLLSYLCYIFVLIIAFIYVKLILRVKIIKNTKIHKNTFIYSNHTQVLGDVLAPFIYSFPRRPYIICSASNLGIPIIGKILPICGALVIPDGLNNTKEFMKGVSFYIKKHPIIIYPEAHLWPWYTKVREFNTSSFHFPIDNKSNVCTSTTTYQDKKIIIYIDNIDIDNTLLRKASINKIHDDVYTTLINRSKLSNYEHILYKRK